MVGISKVSIMKIVLACVGGVAAECGANVPDTVVQLPFVKYGYLIGGYITTLKEGLKEEFIRDPVECERKVRRIFAADRFWSSGDK